MDIPELGKQAGINTEILSPDNLPEFVRRHISLEDLQSGGPRLNKEKLDIINYILADPPVGVDITEFKSEILVKNNNTVSVSRGSLLSLMPNTWVIDEVIDAVVEMANKYQRERETSWSNWYLPTWASAMLNYASAKDVAHRFRTWMGDSLASCRRIYIPMNDNNTHWYLVVFCADDHAVYIIDTMRYNEKGRNEAIDRVISFVQTVVDMKSGDSHQDADITDWNKIEVRFWARIYPLNVPDQTKLSNWSCCGIFVIHFMTDRTQIPHIIPCTVVTPKHRLCVMASLVLWEHNELKNEVMSKVKKLANV